MAIVYSVMAVGNVIISIPLAMWMGPVGSALGTAISLVLVNGLAMNIYYRKKIGLDIPSFWKSILSLMKGVIPRFHKLGSLRSYQSAKAQDLTFL